VCRLSRLSLVLIAFALFGACTGQAEEATTAAAPTTTTTTTTTPAEGAPLPTGLPSKAAFGAFEAVPLLGGTPTVLPDHPTSLDGVFWDFKVPEELRGRIVGAGFAVDPSWPNTLLHPIYSYTARYADGAVYVTTDAGYHEWHLVFSKALRDTEEQELLPLAESLVADLVEAARAQRADLDGSPLATAADDVAQHLEATAALLSLDVGEIGARAAEEVALAELHTASATSPTLGVEVDYTLFAPRGHYTRSADLTRYFRAMAQLGATPFPLESPDALRRAVLLSRLITGNPARLDTWQRVYETTSFLVGAADDYTPVELMAALAAASPEAAGDPAVLTDDAVLAAVADNLRATRPVLIDAEKASVRTMGARFVLDSFLLDQLVHPQVWQRFEASVLDVAAAFGSEWALERQREAGVPAEYPEYEDQVAALRALVADRPLDDWGGTVYDAWLYAILPMWQPHGAAFPDYMQTEAWAARAHQGGFGSYAELKHDTVLYSKEAFAEGDAPLPPAPPRHWVEPDPVPFERMAQAARLLQAGLVDRDLLPDDTGALLERLITMLERFGSIARDELTGLPISTADNDWLAAIGSEFEVLWLAAGEGEPEGAGAGGFAADPESQAPVVTDIFSNPTDALQVATGGFDTIYVLVPNDEGTFQVAVGATYAFYEFWVPRGERLTDEEWRAMLSNGEAPARPEWLMEALSD